MGKDMVVNGHEVWWWVSIHMKKKGEAQGVEYDTYWLPCTQRQVHEALSKHKVCSIH